METTKDKTKEGIDKAKEELEYLKDKWDDKADQAKADWEWEKKRATRNFEHGVKDVKHKVY